MSDVLSAAALIGFGSLEGYAFARVGNLDPQAMEDQMFFRSMMIMKIFASSIGASMVFQSFMSLVSPQKFEESRFYKIASFGYKRSLLGAAILGAGMTLSGSGPTLVASQIGIGVQSALYTVAGMIFGGALFAMLEPRLFGKCVLPQAKPGEKNTLDQVFGTSYAGFALPMGLAMLGGVYGLETLHPHSLDTARTHMGSWWPMVAGAVIGFNQIPLRLITKDGQGGSTSIMNVLATASNGALSGRHKLTNLRGASQLLYVYVGTLLGAYIGAQHEGVPAITGFSPARSFVGGALMMLGARTAGGCGCGTGISGSSEGSLQSFAAAMTIFGSAIATAFAVNAFSS